MDRKDICSIGDVLRQVIEENNMQDRLDELRACNYWRAVAGDYVARRTSRPSVRKGHMVIGVPDAGLRQELSMHRSVIIRDLNRLVGREIIHTLRFIS